MADLAAAALALYNAINPAEMAKVESGELTYVGNKIPAAFAAACTHGVPASSTFTEVFAAKAGESGYDIYASPGMAAAALALYNAIIPVIMAKFESGEFTTGEEAEAYGNKITAAFAAACLDAGDDDFPEVFAAKAAEG